MARTTAAPTLALTFLLLTVAGPRLGAMAQTTLQCTDLEKSQLLEEHRNCASVVRDRLATGLGSDFCARLDEQINDCSRIMTRCFNGEELRLFKDIQIETVVKLLDSQKMSHVYQNCDVTREYLSSGRTLNRATAHCAEDQVKAANAARERCIVEKRDGLRTKIRSVNPQTRIAMHGLLCDFIDQSINECAELIRQCHSTDEMERIRQNSYTVVAESLRVLGSSFDIAVCGGRAGFTENGLLLPAGQRYTSAASGLGGLGSLVVASVVALVMAWGVAM